MSSQAPFFRAIDDAHPLTKSNFSSEQKKALVNLFGPGLDPSIDPEDDRPIVAKTLYEAYHEFDNGYLAQIVHDFASDGSGWWLEFSPAKALPNGSPLTYRWQSLKGQPDMMDPAPEETAPSYLTYTEEEQQRRLVRYNKGFKLLGDLMLTPKGAEILAFQLKQLGSSWWNAIKLLIAQTAIHSKLYWQEKQREFGREHQDIKMAMANEVNYFGILSYDQKGILKLASYVRDLVSIPGSGQGDAPNFTMIVVPPGLKEFLGHAPDYPTEAYRSGTNLTETVRQVGGGQAMEGIVPGMKIYEDQIWNLIGLEEQDVNMFQRETAIGEYTIIDGSNYGSYSDKHPIEKMLTVKIRNVHGWTEVSPTVAIENSFRWDGEGELTGHLQLLIDRLPAELQKSGFPLSDDLVDPYIYRNEPGGPGNGRINPSENAFKVIELWGDVDDRYRTLKQDVQHGRRCITNMESNAKGRSDFEKMREMKDLMTKLYDVGNVGSVEMQGYFFAIAANTENQSQDFYLKANDEGCVQPCYVEKDPSRIHKELGQDQAENLNDGGIMYVMGPNGQKYYVWVFEPDVVPTGSDLPIDFDFLTRGFGGANMSVDFTGGASIVDNPSGEIPQFEKLRDRTGTVNTDLGTSLLQSRAVGVTAQSVPVASLAPASDYTNLPFAFVLAPFDRWGKVEADGTAPHWNSTDPPAELQGTQRKILFRFLANTSGPVGFGSDSMNTHFATLPPNSLTVGVKAPRLVAAPKFPFGYGTVTGMRTLRQLHVNGDPRGWDQAILETAFHGVEAMDRWADKLETIYPRSKMWDTKYTPTYMLSSNKRYDKHTSVMATAWDHVKYPLLVRKPLEYNQQLEPGSMGVDTEFQWVAGGTTGGNPGERVTGFSDGELRVISEALGFAYGTAVAAPFPLTVNRVPQVFTSRDLNDYLKLVLSSPVLSPEIRNLFKDPSQVEKFVRSYAESGMSESYTRTRNREMRDDKDYGLFAHFFVDEVISTMNRDQRAPQTTTEANRTPDMEDSLVAAVKIFSGVSGLIYTVMHSPDTVFSLDRGLIGAFETGHGSKEGKRKRRGMQEEFDPSGDIARTRLGRLRDGSATTFQFQDRMEPSGAYINTRLAVSQKSWHGIAKSLRNIDSTAWATGTGEPTDAERDQMAKISKNILRPSNPENPSMPLAGIVVDYRQLKRGSARPGKDADLVLKELLTFKHARSHAEGEGPGSESSIFANAPLVSTAGAHRGRGAAGQISHPNPLYSGGGGFDVRDPVPSFSPYDGQDQHANPGMMRDLSGPFYTTQEFQDRTGEPLDNMTRFVEKRFMKKRYDHAIEQTKEDDFDRVPTILFLTSEVCKQSLLTWVQNNCPLPDACFILARPWIRLKMDAAFFAEPGAGTSETRYAYPHLVQQYDGTHKKWLFHLTSWMDSAVYDPSKVMTFADVKFSKGGYQGGFDDIMLKDLDQWNPTDPDFDMVSMFSFSCGATFSRDHAYKYANPMSLFGKYDPNAVPTRLSDRLRTELLNARYPHFPSFLFYNSIFNFTAINSGNITRHDSFREQKESGTIISGLMYMGKHYEWSQHDGKYSIENTGTGHLKNMDPPFHNLFNGEVETKSDVYN